MEKYILFGAGFVACKAIEIIGKESIEFIIDNDEKKDGTYLKNIPVFHIKRKYDILKEKKIIVTVSEKYENEIIVQLQKLGIQNIFNLSEIQYEITKKKILERPDYFSIYNKVIEWIKKHTIKGEGIICNTEKILSYPEVTGYYIPSLIRWGYRDIALNYTNWLLSIQKEDGSWYDTDNKSPYIFDSGQILKGLLSIREIYSDKDKIDTSIKKGCEWILSCMDEEGQLVTPNQIAWGKDTRTCSDVIHIYCLSPLIEASKIYKKDEYKEKALKIWNYYKTNYYNKIMNFSLLSHFYAYLMEALLDIGEIEMAKIAMKRMEKYQKESGAIPAYNNCDWVCSTGLFQLSLVWYRLGNYKCANKAFEYACKLQNESGGWYGSYVSEDNPKEENKYFPSAEISWANKYFLDALYYKNYELFNRFANTFQDNISVTDGRYLIIDRIIKNVADDKNILDVGCGKGRYLKNLIKSYPKKNYFAVDISLNVMEDIPGNVVTREGLLTNIPFDNNKFEVTYTCEALEHAIDIKSAIREMARVTKAGGKIVVIDKNQAFYGKLQIGDWEKWFDSKELKQIMLEFCSEVQVIEELDYQEKGTDGLFCAWVGIIKD